MSAMPLSSPAPEPIPTATTAGSTALPARQPAAGDLAALAERTAGDLLTPASPVRLDDVVPAPERVEADPTGAFVLTEDTAIRVTAHPGARQVADHLAELLRPATGFPLPIADALEVEPTGTLTLTLADHARRRASGPRATGST